MKFVVLREQMHHMLQHVTRVIERQQTREILANALIRADDEGTVHMACTDLEISRSATMKGVNVASSGAVTIPGLKLFEIFSRVPTGTEVSVEAQEDNTVRLTAGSSRYSLATLPEEKVPRRTPTDDAERVSIAHDTMHRMLQNAAVAMGKNDVRFYLNGVLLEVSSEHVRTVATDGTRMAVCTQTGGLPGADRLHAIIPRKAVGELIYLLADTEGEVEIEIGKKTLTATINEHSLTTNLFDTRYPQYEIALPPDTDVKMIVDRVKMRQALAQTIVLAAASDRLVRFQLGDNVLRLESSNEKGDKAHVEIGVQYSFEEKTVGFNGEKLLEVLDTLRTEEVEVFFPPESTNVRLNGIGEQSELFYVLSPMRL